MHVDSLPRVSDLDLLPLEARYKTVLLIGRTIFTTILALIVVALFLFPFPDRFPNIARYGPVIFFIVSTIWGYIKTVKGFQHKRYALREKDIVYASGWLWKEITTAPFVRVQHVSIDQGPIERQFDLAKLRIYTAGGKASDMTIPGLSPDTAYALKEYIVGKTLHKQPESTLSEERAGGLESSLSEEE